MPGSLPPCSALALLCVVLVPSCIGPERGLVPFPTDASLLDDTHPDASLAPNQTTDPAAAGRTATGAAGSLSAVTMK